jgi:hypothetical protein
MVCSTIKYSSIIINGLEDNITLLQLEISVALVNGVHWKQHLQMLDLLLPIGLYLQEVLEDNLTIQDMSVEPIGTLLTLLTIGLLRRAMLRPRAGRTSLLVTSPTAVRRTPTGFVPSGV